MEDLQDSLHLVWDTFLEFEAPEYSDDGVQEFKKFIEFDAIVDMLSKSALLIWECIDVGKVIGVIATRLPCHIALLFVDKNYHRRGIARALYQTVLNHYETNSEHSTITVNSSPYAVDAYRRLGFVDTDNEQLMNGIRFIPMKHKFR
jgi:ribosomal protein S18 acetylase RimI-like enzyme